jgi:hypothetical protein
MRTSKVATYFILHSLTILIGCEKIIRNGPIVSGYANADCIPVRFGPGIQPPSRAWDYTLTTKKGMTVHVSGAEVPGGRIDVRYIPKGAEVVAADAGDYIYPTDVRLDRRTDTLFVKASGSPATSNESQTWIFEYDLNNQKQIASIRVDPSVLPSECQIR